ncbi:hypothetical protein BDQ17DRAFT_1428593 [Cyathus striatus]|nr:hypothetical protein BDQ17DRAFT_1428593 [Cyathus striatus]
MSQNSPPTAPSVFVFAEIKSRDGNMQSPTYNSVAHSQRNSPFFQASNFTIDQATFNENNAVDVKKVAEFDFTSLVIHRVTYQELSDERQEHFKDLEVPSNIRGWIQNPNDSFKSSRFLNTTNKDILALTGVPIVRYFINNETPGIKLAAHILFYEIPLTEQYDGISVRPDRSHRWVMTLAYQLMVNIDKLRDPMVAALRTHPRLPQHNSKTQLQRLIIEPLQYTTAEGLLPSNTIMLVLLDCIDCSKNAPTVASDIAYLVKELERLNGQPLKFLVTGLPDHTVLSRFYKVSIEISELQRPTQVAQQLQNSEAPPAPSLYERWSRLTIFQKVHCILSLMALGIMVVGSTMLVKVGVCMYAFGAVCILGKYWRLRLTRPWDIHGREETVKKDILLEFVSIPVIILQAIGSRR